MSRVLVVEDEQHLAEGLRFNLEAEGYQVQLVDAGEAALEKLKEEAPEFDVVILDVMLPGMSGFDVISQMRESGQYVPTLMLTARGHPDDVLRGFAAGADDYLTKPFAVAELLARVRALVRRRLNDGGRLLRYADIEMDRHQRRVLRAGRTIVLTAKEFALLEFLLTRAPEPVHRSEIVEHVWDTHFDTETNLVEVYINRLRQKISVAGDPKIIQTVHGVGYCLKVAE
jgi:DNA-binding response OmpR family regulator